jgi:hypothetical protein
MKVTPRHTAIEPRNADAGPAMPSVNSPVAAGATASDAR